MAAPVVYTCGYFEINGKNLSQFSPSLAANYGSEQLDRTTMGVSTRLNKSGLLDWSLDGTFFWDCSTGGPEQTLWGLVGTSACIEYRPYNMCSSANNPIYSGICNVVNFNQGGGVGTLLQGTASFNSASALSRASSS